MATGEMFSHAPLGTTPETGVPHIFCTGATLHLCLCDLKCFISETPDTRIFGTRPGVLSGA